MSRVVRLKGRVNNGRVLGDISIPWLGEAAHHLLAFHHCHRTPGPTSAWYSTAGPI